jgi:hypothetical protein
MHPTFDPSGGTLVMTNAHYTCPIWDLAPCVDSSANLPWIGHDSID